MVGNVQQLRDEEQRLAALWADPLDDAPTLHPANEAIAALFSSVGSTSPICGEAPRRRVRRRCGRTPNSSRSLRIRVTLVVALVLVSVALLARTSASPGPVVLAPTRPPVDARQSAPTRAEHGLRHMQTRRVRERRRPERRARVASTIRNRSTVARRVRVAPKHAPPARPAVRGREVPAIESETARRQPSSPPHLPTSSACDEFPPC
jgi:hypothetical protein